MSVNKNSFRRIKIIGLGAFGRVYKVSKNDGEDVGTLYAMKKVGKKRDMAEMAMRERDALCQVVGVPFLAQLRYAFQSRKHLYLVMELASGADLRQRLELQGILGEDQARLCVAQLVAAVGSLHAVGYVHRDVKPENVLVDSRGDIVLADLGLCGAAGGDLLAECGTLEYTAPEILDPRRARGYSGAVDWWSVGVVTCELLTGSPPFAARRWRARSAVRRSILREAPALPDQLPISSRAKAFIASTLAKVPGDRLGGWDGNVEEVKAHPFFSGICWSAVESKNSKPPFIPGEHEKTISCVDWILYVVIRPIIDPGFSGICFQRNVCDFTYVAPRNIGINNTPLKKVKLKVTQ